MSPAGRILLSLMDSARAGASLPVLLCEGAARKLPVMGVGMTLVDTGDLVASAASSGPAVADLEDLQVSLGEGPGVEAGREGRFVMVPDLAAVAADRWPAYTPAVIERGVRAVMAFPLRVGGIHLGVLTLYRSDLGALHDEDLALALQYADAAVLVLLNLQSFDDHGAGKESHQGPLPGATALDAAFQGQPEVHQATGMVSVQAGVDLKEALLLLQAHAFTEGVPIVEVARAVLARSTSFHDRSWSEPQGPG